MCLNDIHATSSEPDEEFIFYKVVVRHEDKYHTPVRRQPLEIGRTYFARHEDGNDLRSWDGQPYERGFHLFALREDAEQVARLRVGAFRRRHAGVEPVVMEIEARGVHTIGLDWGHLVVVAREITPRRVLTTGRPDGPSPDDGLAVVEGSTPK